QRAGAVIPSLCIRPGDHGGRRPDRILRSRVLGGKTRPPAGTVRSVRIVLVNKFAHLTGGADRHCLALAKVLRERGHDVVFLSTAGAENVESRGIFVRATVTHGSRDTLVRWARARAALAAFWN